MEKAFQKLKDSIFGTVYLKAKKNERAFWKICLIFFSIIILDAFFIETFFGKPMFIFSSKGENLLGFRPGGIWANVIFILYWTLLFGVIIFLIGFIVEVRNRIFSSKK